MIKHTHIRPQRPISASNSSNSSTSYNSTSTSDFPNSASTFITMPLTAHRLALLTNLTTQRTSLSALITNRQCHLQLQHTLQTLDLESHGISKLTSVGRCGERGTKETALLKAELVILRRRLGVVEGKIEEIGRELSGVRRREGRGKGRGRGEEYGREFRGGWEIGVAV